ncbi:MAG: Na+/H+ antiporter subunit E [Candidatus Omnitrophota bacterium]
MILNKIILFIIYFMIWALLSWPIDTQHVIAGVIVSAVVTGLTSYLFIRRPQNFRQIKRYFWFLVYAAALSWEFLKANVDMALRVLDTRPRVNPGMIRVKTVLRSDTAITFLANSITLMPGVFFVDLDAENGVMHVHCLDIGSGGAAAAIGKIENIIKRVFE